MHYKQAFQASTSASNNLPGRSGKGSSMPPGGNRSVSVLLGKTHDITGRLRYSLQYCWKRTNENAAVCATGFLLGNNWTGPRRSHSLEYHSIKFFIPLDLKGSTC